MEHTILNYNNRDYKIIKNVTFIDNYNEEVTIDVATTELWHDIESAVDNGNEMETYIDSTFGFYLPPEIIEKDDNTIIKYLKENYC